MESDLRVGLKVFQSSPSACPHLCHNIFHRDDANREFHHHGDTKHQGRLSHRGDTSYQGIVGKKRLTQ